MRDGSTYMQLSTNVAYVVPWELYWAFTKMASGGGESPLALLLLLLLLLLLEMPEQSNDYRVVVFGAGGVGKTSLVLRFIHGTFRDSYIPTIEDTYRKVITSNNSICTLLLTDTTGSHQFPAMQRLSISKGHAFILVFSVTSKQSLEELKPILESITEVKGDLDNLPIMLVGNKCDEEPSRREVTLAFGQALEKMWKCKYMETSAKEGTNVTELFEELLKLDTTRQLSLEPIEKMEAKKIKDKCIIQ